MYTCVKVRNQVRWKIAFENLLVQSNAQRLYISRLESNSALTRLMNIDSSGIAGVSFFRISQRKKMSIILRIYKILNKKLKMNVITTLRTINDKWLSQTVLVKKNSTHYFFWSQCTRSKVWSYQAMAQCSWWWRGLLFSRGFYDRSDP